MSSPYVHVHHRLIGEDGVELTMLRPLVRLKRDVQKGEEAFLAYGEHVKVTPEMLTATYVIV